LKLSQKEVKLRKSNVPQFTSDEIGKTPFHNRLKKPQKCTETSKSDIEQIVGTRNLKRFPQEPNKSETLWSKERERRRKRERPSERLETNLGNVGSKNDFRGEANKIKLSNLTVKLVALMQWRAENKKWAKL